MMTANELFGGGPSQGIAGLPGGGLKSVTAGQPVPSPDASAAPRATTSRASVGDLMDDPTFWLVVMFGTVILLASASN